MCRKQEKVPDSITGQNRKRCEKHPKQKFRKGKNGPFCQLCRIEEQKAKKAKNKNSTLFIQAADPETYCEMCPTRRRARLNINNRNLCYKHAVSTTGRKRKDLEAVAGTMEGAVV